MLPRLFTIISLAIALAAAGPAWSYDAALAESYAKLFAPVQGAGAGKALHLIKPEAFLNKIKAKEPLVMSTFSRAGLRRSPGIWVPRRQTLLLLRRQPRNLPM
jgi:hypothetical protein